MDRPKSGPRGWGEAEKVEIVEEKIAAPSVQPAKVGGGIWDWSRGMAASFAASMPPSLRMRGALMDGNVPGVVSSLVARLPANVRTIVARDGHGDVNSIFVAASVAFFTLIAVVVIGILMNAIVKKGRKKKLATIMAMIESDPELQIFHRYWQGMGDEGPWDRPDLSKPPAAEVASKGPASGAKQETMVLFAPTNDAFQDGQRIIMSVDAAGWRKLLVSHCAFTTISADSLAHADSCKSCTGAMIPLDCLRDAYSDGTAKCIAALQASNGVLFKIRRVVQPMDQR